MKKWLVSVISASLTVGGLSSMTYAGTGGHAIPTPLSILSLPPQSAANAPNAPGHWTPEPATYGIVREQNVPIRMSDGTVLLADVYRPADASGKPASGTFPVILTQTPYRKTGVLTTTGGDGYYPYLVQRGYINVIVDVRGTGSSEGSWEMFGPREVQDGVELVRWCGHNLPGSNRKVGLAGASYLGINQLLIAGAVGRGSSLKAIFPVIAANDIYRDTAFQGGIPDTEFSIPWLALRGGLDMLPSDDTQNNPVEATQVELAHAGGIANFDAPFLTEIETGGNRAYDESWWQTRNPRSVLQNIVHNEIPAFMVGGWFDIFQHGELLNFTGLQNAYVGRPVSAPMTAKQAVTGRYQLVMGPWYHLTATEGQMLQTLQLAWFDHWLKDENTGIQNTNRPLHLYELGANQWVDTDRWPVASTKVQTEYFGAGPTGTASSLNDGSLNLSKPNASNKGADALPWTGGNLPLGRSVEQWAMGASTYALGNAGLPPLPNTQDDRAFEASGLTYTTEPFTQAKVLAGPLDVTLYAASTTPDTEFVATLEDIKPNGQAYPLTSGALLGSFRALDDKQSWYEDGKLLMPWHPYTKTSQHPVVTGKTTRFDVEVFPTFAYIAPGDRLRVTLTSSDEPHLTPTPIQMEHLLSGVYQIQRNSHYASYINLPLLPADAFTPSETTWGPTGQ